MSVLALLRPSGGSNGPGGSVSKTLCCALAAYFSMGEVRSPLPVSKSAVKHRPHLGHTTDMLPFASSDPSTAPRSHQGQEIFFSSFLFGTGLIPPVDCYGYAVNIYKFVKSDWKKLAVSCPGIQMLFVAIHDPLFLSLFGGQAGLLVGNDRRTPGVRLFQFKIRQPLETDVVKPDLH